MKINNPSRIRTEKGQSMTEFALSLVILLTLLAGIVDLGRMFFAYIIIRDAAQEGAVYGSIAPKDDLGVLQNEVEARVKAAFTDPADSSNVPIDITKLNVVTNILGATCAMPGSGIRVRVDYTVPVTMPFLGTIIGSQDMKMSATAENAILSPVCP
ncbi:MAG: pilus assembly protein [Candidatus Aminicenantes bacterium]|nr:MAG: pilus assembly protein [Candidatus Aminicenantes bacterium]